jgi:hypothetical protein
MLTVCWSAKGGSGTTVVAAAIALASNRPALLIDLAGDVPAVLGMPDPGTQGVLDWAGAEAPAERLSGLAVRVSPTLEVVPRGGVDRVVPPAPPERWAELGAWLATCGRFVIVDAGSAVVPPAGLVQAAERNLLVTRPCYLAMRAAVRQPLRPTAVVLVDEPGRALDAADVEASLGAPVVVTLLLDPAVARAVDVGLLATRLPAGIRRALRSLA